MLPTTFNFQGAGVRVVILDDEPWFVAKDVCDILGLEQVSRAMDRLEEDERGLVKVTHPQSISKTIDVNAVNEPGLYQLIMASYKSEAKQFKRWITHEVLPQIRKTGSYVNPKSPMLEDVLIAQLEAMKEVKMAQQQQAAALTDHEFRLAEIDQKVTNQITLTTAEQKRVQGAVNARVRGLGNNVYYSKIYGALKKQFEIPSYRDLKRADLSRAFRFIEYWTPGDRTGGRG